MSRLVLWQVVSKQKRVSSAVAGGRSKYCPRSQIEVKCLQRECVGETLDGQEISKGTSAERKEISQWKTRLVLCSVPYVRDSSG